MALPDCMIPDGNNGACEAYLALARDLDEAQTALAEVVAYADGPGELRGDYNWEMVKHRLGFKSELGPGK